MGWSKELSILAALVGWAAAVPSLADTRRPVASRPEVTHAPLREFWQRPLPIGRLKPLPKIPPVKEDFRHAATRGASAGGSNHAPARRVPAAGSPVEVYRNTRNLAGLPPGAGVLVADDLYLSCSGGGELGLLEFAVGGGQGGGLGFSVDFQLYDACPGQGGQPLAGASGSARLPDDDVYVVSIDFTGLGVAAPENFWLALTLSTDTAFVVVAGPPELGFSEDLIHFGDPDAPQLSCNTWFGGYPIAEHASVYAVVQLAQCSGTNRFLGYRSEAFSGMFHGGTAGALAADDVVPLVPDCELVGLDLEYAGASGPFEARVELRRDAAGSPGSLIPGSIVAFSGDGNGTLETMRFSFDPPVLLPQRFWMLHSDDSPDAGPVIAGAGPIVGASADLFQSWNAARARWEALFFGRCGTSSGAGCGTFNATLWCANAPPDPLAACCLGHGCEDHTALACAQQGGDWRPGALCEQGGDACFPAACGSAGGDCFSALEVPGCQDPACCSAVCEADDFCCAVQWDGNCAALAAELCTPVSNDRCSGASVLAPGTVAFTTLAATDDGPTLPAQCDEGFGAGLGADVWYEYLAVDCGTIAVSTCSTADFDTRLAVYAGCDCPVDNVRLLACNDDGLDCIGFTSRLSFSTQAGICYKIRLGGYNGAAGSGTLSLTHNPEGCDIPCPAGTVTFLDPPDGVIDARQPHRLEDPDDARGIRSLLISAPAGAEDPACWSVCDGSAESPTGVASVRAGPSGTLVVELSRALAPGSAATVLYAGGAAQATFIVHPGNVNGDGEANNLDVLAVIDYLNGVAEPPWGIYSSDVDHSGLLAPADILAVTDLLNGAGTFAPWGQTLRPVSGACP